MTKPLDRDRPSQFALPLTLPPCSRRARTGRICFPFLGVDGRQLCTDCGEGWTR